MILLSTSKFQSKNPFTEEKRKVVTDFFKPIELDLKKEIENLIKKTEESYSIIINPIIERGEIGLVLTVDISNPRLELLS